MSDRRPALYRNRVWLLAGLFLAVVVYLAYANGLLFGGGDPLPGDPDSTRQAAPDTTDQGPVQLGPSGLKIPRFVSLKSDRVNVRLGPSKDHAIAWVFRRQGLPVEIVAEFEHWRQIRDSEGTEGWVIQSLLSGRRTVLVAPWSENAGKTFPLRESADEQSDLVAQVEQNLLASLLECQNSWCRISVQDIDGWILQNLLWGVGPNEVLN